MLRFRVSTDTSQEIDPAQLQVLVDRLDEQGRALFEDWLERLSFESWLRWLGPSVECEVVTTDEHPDDAEHADQEPMVQFAEVTA
jgi:hypothetical protein